MCEPIKPAPPVTSVLIRKVSFHQISYKKHRSHPTLFCPIITVDERSFKRLSHQLFQCSFQRLGMCQDGEDMQSGFLMQAIQGGAVLRVEHGDGEHVTLASNRIAM